MSPSIPPTAAAPRSITAAFRPASGRRAPAPDPAGEDPAGRVPRVSRLMALAIRFEGLLASGAVADQAELATLGRVTRARVTQIMNLLHLAPDIQEALLFMPPVTRGKDPVTEHEMRAVAAEVSWADQRRRWRTLTRWPEESMPSRPTPSRSWYSPPETPPRSKRECRGTSCSRPAGSPKPSTRGRRSGTANA